MKRTRKMKITKVQRRSVRLLEPGISRQTGVQPPVVRAHCPVCEREVETLTKTQAAEVLELNDQALDGFIADGQVHAIRTVSGSLRVCKDSLFQPTEPTKDMKRNRGS